jgi:hypothetical protein
MPNAIISVTVMDASGTVLGEGPLTAISATVTETLDAAGKVAIDLPLGDARVASLFQIERRVRIYVDGTVFGEGYIQEVRVRRSASDFVLSGNGPDLLNVLQRKTTLRGRAYDNVAIGTVISALATLGGWTASTSASDLVFVRFDGQSVLKALRSVAESKGYHVRAGTTSTSLEVGAFGSSTGLYAFEAAAPDAVNNPALLLIESIEVLTDSKDVVNWIEPIGGSGAGEGEQTLRECHAAGSRTTGGGYPYSIQTMTGPRGQTVYYLKDTASVTVYGQIEQVTPFRDVKPLSNAATDVLRGSEALYDVAAAWLQRYSQPLKTLALSVRPAVGVDASLIRVGNKIRVVYKGVAQQGADAVTYLDVDADYWIMGVRKFAGLGGVGYTLEVASVDRVAQDAESVVLGALADVQLRGVSVAQYFSHYSFTYEKEVAPSFDAVIPLDVTAVTRSISRVLLRLTSRPFRATASGTASGGGVTSNGGGDHNHRMFLLTSVVGFPSATMRPYLGRLSNGGTFVYMKLETSGDSDLWTESSSGAHTHTLPAHSHALSYGISDDTTYPAGVQVWINGTNRTSALGGPWGSTGAGIDVELDITQYITAGTLRQRHTITIKCTSGQGIVQGNVDVQETITSVDVSL